MKKIIIWLYFIFFSLCVQAKIHVQIDPAQITLGEVFKLSLILEESQNSGVPDLSPLQTDFVILGTERNINYSVINGKTQSSSQWIVALRAKKEGIITIPAIKIGFDESAPLTINVEAKANSQPIQDDTSQYEGVMLSGEVSDKKPYVNQQITYNVKLYHSKRLLDANYQGPQVEDALVIPLGEEKSYQTVLNNTNYVVEEQNYAIFPQKSGALKIVSPIFTALVYDFDAQRIKVQDKTINLDVQSIPKQYSGKIWLPAKQIKLKDEYEHSDQNMNQGSTLVRTVTIEGVAIPAQLLPIPSFEESDAFHVYTEKGTEKNQMKQGQLIGSTEIKVTYLFNKAGHIVIPELRLPWFNTETAKEEIAILPPRSLEIKPSVAVANNTPQKPDTVSGSSNASLPENQSITQSSHNWPWIFALLFACAWVITLALWGWQRYLKTAGKGQYKKVLKELNKACMEGNSQNARDAILKWASVYWPDATLLNLTDLTKLVKDVSLKKQLHILSQVLYKEDNATQWRGNELWRAVQGLKHNKNESKSRNRALPPINPF